MTNKIKSTPLRKCVVTQKLYPKKELIRIVKTANGQIIIDSTGKMNGRGAYMCPDKNVVAQAQKNHALERSLKTKISADVYQEILTTIENEWD